MGNEVEPRVHDCIVRVCQDCIDLKGQECHVPECVFCFKGMDEAKWLLDKMLICPIIEGERYILAGDAVEAEARVSAPPPSVGEANDIELLARNLVWSPDSWDAYLIAKEAGDGPTEGPEFWLLAQAVESKFGPQPPDEEDLAYADRVISKIKAARTDDDVDAILRRADIEPKALVSEFISRMGKELRLALADRNLDRVSGRRHND